MMEEVCHGLPSKLDLVSKVIHFNNSIEISKVSIDILDLKFNIIMIFSYNSISISQISCT